MTQPKNEVIAYIQACEGMYAFFSPLFLREINQEQWEHFLLRLKVLPSFCENSALDDLRKVAYPLAKLPEKEIINELASCYAKMFLGVSEQPSIPLVQSFYTSSEGLAYGEAFFEAKKQYQNMHLMLDPEINLPEDHLGVILAFLAHYAKITAEQPSAKNIEALSTLRDDLLASWLPKITEMASTHYTQTLYTELLAYLLEFTRYDQQEMKKL